MTTSARAASVATLVLTSTLGLGALGATPAGAADSAPRTKAAIEHEERQVTAVSPTKAQVEHAERTSHSTVPEAASATTPTAVPDGGDAAVWQLALAAALGALVTGTAVAGAHVVNRNRMSGHAVAP